MDYSQAKIFLTSGDSSSSDWFKTNGYTLEYAYSLLISGKIAGACKELEKIKEYDTRADWAWKLSFIINDNTPPGYPTFLQVRNFLEIDLDLFIKSKNFSYINSLLRYAPTFNSICRESYKFIGRALYYNSFEDLAIKYYKLAKDSFYNDGELHYLLGKYYFKRKEKASCIKSLRTCLNIIGEYSPAEKMLKTLFDK